MRMNESDYDTEEPNWEDGEHLSIVSEPPLAIQKSRQKKQSYWQRIDQLKDEVALKRQLADDYFDTLV